MQRRELFLRADGNNEISYGHINRVIAISQLLDNCFKFKIILKKSSQNIVKHLQKLSLDFLELPITVSDTDEALYLKRIHGINKVLIIIDGYDFNQSYFNTHITNQNTVIYIDDFLRTNIKVHGLLSHIPGLKESSYKYLINPFLALGSNYTLIKPIFFETERKEKSATNVLICFGGTDNKNLVLTTLNNLQEIDENVERVVIVGGGYSRFSDLEDYIKQNPSLKISVYSNILPDLLSKLISNATIAIAPASTISLEICTIGVPLITGSYIENQNLLLKSLEYNKCVLSIGDFNKLTKVVLEKEVNNLIQSKAKRKFLINQCKKCFSTNVKEKLFTYLEVMFNLAELIPIKAVKEHEKLLFDWVVEDDVRKNSKTQEKITIKSHKNWYMSKLNSRNTFIFIFYVGTKPVGQVRFDKKEDFFEIDYSVDKNFRGQGLGKRMLYKAELLISAYTACSKLRGVVLKNNIPSEKVFYALGYKKIFEIVYENRCFYFFDKELIN